MEPAECAFAGVWVQGSPTKCFVGLWFADLPANLVRWFSACCVLGMAMLLAGCGETSRPVVTPVAVTGPAPQPQSYTVVTTTSGTGSPGLANVFDASGDTLLTQALLGNGPSGAHPQLQRRLCHHRQY